MVLSQPSVYNFMTLPLLPQKIASKHVLSDDKFNLNCFSHQMQEKRVSHSMLNTSTGKEYLFVGLILKESNNVTTPTQLKMTVTVPKTELYTFSLRYRVC